MFKCFWIEPIGTAKESWTVSCTACGEYTRGELGLVFYVDHNSPRIKWDDVPWPTTCAKCGHVFDFDAGGDFKSTGRRPLYRRTDTGEEGEIRDFGVGAMWDASWYHRKGPDGRSLAVRLPGDHDWMIDSQASNCDQKDRDHYCWVRTGDPPNVTVNKGAPGQSCNAGGGSIWANMPKGWHGFLTRGYLHDTTEAAP